MGVNKHVYNPARQPRQTQVRYSPESR